LSQQKQQQKKDQKGKDPNPVESPKTATSSSIASSTEDVTPEQQVPETPQSIGSSDSKDLSVATPEAREMPSSKSIPKEETRGQSTLDPHVVKAIYRMDRILAEAAAHAEGTTQSSVSTNDIKESPEVAAPTPEITRVGKNEAVIEPPLLPPSDEKSKQMPSPPKPDPILTSLPKDVVAVKELSPSPLSSPVNTPNLVSSDDFDEVEEEEEDEFETEVSPLPERRRIGVTEENIASTEKESKEDDWTMRNASPNRANFFTRAASPKLMGHGVGYNEEYPEDITAVRKPWSKPDRMTDTEDAGATNKETTKSPSSSADLAPAAHLAPFESLRTREDKCTMSSIDAFEASFKTDFTDSFTPRDAEAETVKSLKNEEIYNPFSSSPAKPTGSFSRLGVEIDDAITWNQRVDVQESVEQGLRGRSRNADPPGVDRTSPRKRSPATRSPLRVADIKKTAVTMGITSSVRSLESPDDYSPRISPRKTSGAGMTLRVSPQKSPVAPTPKTPEEIPAKGRQIDESFQTPGSLIQVSPTASTNSTDQPNRPEKTGYDAARLRYERALQPRSGSGSLRHSSSSYNSNPRSDEKSRDSLVPSDEKVAAKRSSYLRPSTLEKKLQPQALLGGSAPSSRDRLSPSLSASLQNEKRSLWGTSAYQEEDGDIPLRSSLKRNTDLPINGSNRPDAGDRSLVQNNRHRPWDRKSSSGSAPEHLLGSSQSRSSSSEDEIDPSNSPLARSSTRKSFDQQRHQVQASSFSDPAIASAERLLGVDASRMLGGFEARKAAMQ